jgi:hypothetical protein
VITIDRALLAVCVAVAAVTVLKWAVAIAERWLW